MKVKNPFKKKTVRPPSKLFLMVEETLQRIGTIEGQLDGVLAAIGSMKSASTTTNNASSERASTDFQQHQQQSTTASTTDVQDGTEYAAFEPYADDVEVAE